MALPIRSTAMVSRTTRLEATRIWLPIESRKFLLTVNTHTNYLLKLFDELRSFADQACDAVIREARCADRIEETMAVEIKALQEQIKEKEEFLQARDLVLARFEETMNAKFSRARKPH